MDSAVFDCVLASQHLIEKHFRALYQASQDFIFINRLSDLLFVLGRTLNRSAGAADVLWVQGGRSSD